MKLASNNKLIYLLLTIGFIAGVVVIFFTQVSYGGADNYSHYKFAHWGWEYPKLLFNHWGKPVFTILSSPFAQFGAVGMQIYNLLLGFGTAIIIWKIALKLNLKNSPISILLVLFTPIYFILLFTTLTEISFSFFLAIGILFFFKRKYILSALLISLLPLIRTEGIVLFPLFIIAFALKKQLKAIPFMLVGFLVITILGYQYYNDIWWLITKMPYSGDAKDIYGSGSFFHFIKDTRVILGYPIGALSIIGLFESIYNWIVNDKYKLTNTFYFLLLVSGSYLLFLTAHSFVWWQGMGNSLGLVRVIASVAPLAALLALIGLNRLQTILNHKCKSLSFIIVALLLVWIIILGVDTNISGFNKSRPQKLIYQTSQYLKNNSLLNNKIYYFDPQLIADLEIDPFDNTKSAEGIPNSTNISKSMPDNSIIVWDAHFGNNQGRIPLSRLKNNADLTLINVFKPTHPFKVLGGYDYAVYVFQKTHNKGTYTINDEKQVVKEISINSENEDLIVDSNMEYFSILNYNLPKLVSPSNSLLIDFGIAISCSNNKNNEILSVCTIENNNRIFFYTTFSLSDSIATFDKWSVLHHTFKIYDMLEPVSTLKVYIWNKGKTTFDIDSIRVKVSTFNSQLEQQLP